MIKYATVSIPSIRNDLTLLLDMLVKGYFIVSSTPCGSGVIYILATYGKP